MDNGPISVSAPNTSLRTASGKNIIFNTRYPFAKLDSTKTESFQVINILFAKDTPNPDGTINTTNSTLVYQFAHGYTYVPSTWFLTSVDGFATSNGSEGIYLVGGGDIPDLGSAYFSAQVDSQNVNFYINKIYNASFPGATPPSVLGITLSVRSYVFVNDLSGQDVPTHS